MELKNKPLLVRQVNLWWYAAALVPLVALLLLGLSGILPQLVGLFAIFALFFWLFSFGFALYGKLRKPPAEPRQ